MKTAVIFYTFDGNCALLAQHIKSALGADLYRVKLEETKKRTGFFKFLYGMSIMFKKPEPLPLSVDINAYELIILGAPVWGGSPASPIVSFLNKTKISGKKVAFFCSHGGSMGKFYDKFRGLLSGNTIVGEIDFKNPANQDSAVLEEQIAEWVKGFK